MNGPDRAAGALDRLILPLIGLLVFVPGLTFLPNVVDNAHQARETLIVCLGWAVILTGALASALRGSAWLGAGAGSWTRRGLAALGLVVGLGALFSRNPGVSLGHFWSVLTLGLVGFTVWGWLERSPERRRSLFGTLVAFAGLQGLIGLSQLVHLPWTDWGVALSGMKTSGIGPSLRDLAAQTCLMLGATSDRTFATGSLGNPNFLAEYLALVLPLGAAMVAAVRSTWARVAWGAPVALALVVFLATGARGATVGVLAALVVAAIAVWGARGLDVRRALAHRKGRLVAAAALVALLAVSPLVAGRVVEKFGHLGTDRSIEARLVNWGVAVELWKEHPILGTGLGTFKLRNVDAMMALHPDGAAVEGWQSRFIQAHNEPLQGLVEFGLLGFLLAIATLGAWAWETRRNPSLTDTQKFSLLAGVGGLFLAACFGFPLHIPETAVALMLVLAAGLARPPLERPALAPAWRPAYALAATAACLILAGAIIGRVVLPLQEALHTEYAAQVLVEARDFDGAEVVSALAVREHRFKGQALTLEAQSLYQQNKYEALIALIDQSRNEGLDYGLDYLKGWALHRLHRDVEARPLVAKVAKFCGDQTAMGRNAQRLLKSIDQPVAAPPSNVAPH